VPPRPWTKFNKGGYLLLDSLIMRGAYGPYGPAKAQVDAMRDDEQRAKEASPDAFDAVYRAFVAKCLTAAHRCAQAGQPSGFQRVLDALNVLGNTKWCVCIHGSWCPSDH
jgi:hypothetical protein